MKWANAHFFKRGIKMKKLIIIGGTMGVGKTTVCQALKKELNQSVFLDGDWCWDMHPFVVNEETKSMVMDNICHLLNNFIHCHEYQNILFCWVMHKQSIIDELLSRLDTSDCEVYAISLVCSASTLKKQIKSDINKGIRTQDVLQRSLDRLDMYTHLNTILLDKTDLSMEETIIKIKQIIGE